MVPPPPSAATRVAEAKPAVLIGACDGATRLPVSPPSLVRTSWFVAVAMTQVVTAGQEMSVRFCGPGSVSPFATQVAPPSDVARNSDCAPTAKPFLSSRKSSFFDARWLESTSVHEFAASVVR